VSTTPPPLINGGGVVLYQAKVGAFEVTVLSGGTADEVSTWLQANGYQSISTAPAILADYVSKGYVFAAVKLTGGAGIKEIHPLVFRYPGNEPCVPLKLTAVAATPDMGVRVFFLGDDRVYPSNYKHLVLNPLRVDWNSFGANYNAAITRAVDSTLANGQAFVTEYAGASRVVSASGLSFTAWNADRFRALPPQDVIDELAKQGLAYCYVSNCVFTHPLLLPLLERYLPAPAGVTEDAFYACLKCSSSCSTCYSQQIDPLAWDSSAFANDLKERIIDPGAHAAALLTKWPYLTRLFTTISPSEMTVDPLFHARPDLSLNVVGPPALATLRTCNASTAMILPDSREVALDASGWPVFSSLMPWAERIEEVPATGDVIPLADNTATINDQLALWNQNRNWPPPDGCSCGGGGAGGTGQIGGGATGAAQVVGGGQFGFGGGTRAGSGGASIEATPGVSADGGCACSLPGRTEKSGAYAVLGLAGVALLRRRRA
jgi:MYXO-CTERM domain-containing protein